MNDLEENGLYYKGFRIEWVSYAEGNRLVDMEAYKDGVTFRVIEFSLHSALSLMLHKIHAHLKKD